MTDPQTALTPDQLADQAEALTLQFAGLLDGVPVAVVLESATWLIRATAETHGEEQQAIVILVDAAIRLRTKLGGGSDVTPPIPSIH